MVIGRISGAMRRLVVFGLGCTALLVVGVALDHGDTGGG